MAYTKQNFADGQVLNAEHLNHMEDGIEGVSKIVLREEGDTLTWDGNTEGLAFFADSYYRVSDVVPTLADISAGGSVACGSTIIDFDSSLVGEMDGVQFIGDADFPVIYIVGDDIAETLGVPSGTYFLYFPEWDTVVTSLTINGYTGFVTEKIDTKYLPPSGAVFHDNGSEYLYRSANNNTDDNRVTLSELMAAVNRGEQVYVHYNGGYMAAVHIVDCRTYGIVRTLTTTTDAFKFFDYYTAEYTGS